MPLVTIGFSLHRPEMAPLIADCMHRHGALFLEEPPSENFEEMLSGRVTIDDYLMTVDAEYPEFAKIMCGVMRECHSGGKKIFQVEPYLENLIALQDLFADSLSPDELDKNTVMYAVYVAEKNATGALIAYYQAAAGGSFGMTVEAVARFARRDAARFRLRDALRAVALSSMVASYPSSFVEAGIMHYPLKRLLAGHLSADTNVQVLFLTDQGRPTWGRQGHLYGPGDQLTLLYLYHPKLSGTSREMLLAARALIYAKIIIKEELPAEATAFPHLQDERLCIEVTRQLSLNDCRRLFALVRNRSTPDARQLVAEYIMSASPRLARALKNETLPG